MSERKYFIREENNTLLDGKSVWIAYKEDFLTSRGIFTNMSMVRNATSEIGAGDCKEKLLREVNKRTLPIVVDEVVA